MTRTLRAAEVIHWMENLNRALHELEDIDFERAPDPKIIGDARGSIKFVRDSLLYLATTDVEIEAPERALMAAE